MAKLDDGIMFPFLSWSSLVVNPSTSIRGKNSKFASEIERVPLKNNLHAHSMLGLYIMSYDTLPLLWIYTQIITRLLARLFTDQNHKITGVGEAKIQAKLTLVVGYCHYGNAAG